MKKWSILILTQPSRAEFLRRLLGVLSPQAAAYPDVELVVSMFDQSHCIGENRALMLRNAAAEYVNFVDDDDLVADDYVASIYPLLDGVDYVGFQLCYYVDGIQQAMTYHSLRYGGWRSGGDNGALYYRDLSHLNPIKKEWALLGRMEDHKAASFEDECWAERVRQSGMVKTEHYIPRVMYHYYWRTGKNKQSLTPRSLPVPVAAEPYLQKRRVIHDDGTGNPRYLEEGETV